MPATAEVWSTVLVSALAILLYSPVQGVVVKVDLYRRNSNLDKSKSRATRNVLCESQPRVLATVSQTSVDMPHRPGLQSYQLLAS